MPRICTDNWDRWSLHKYNKIVSVRNESIRAMEKTIRIYESSLARMNLVMSMKQAFVDGLIESGCDATKIPSVNIGESVLETERKLEETKERCLEERKRNSDTMVAIVEFKKKMNASTEDLIRVLGSWIRVVVFVSDQMSNVDGDFGDFNF